MEHLLAQFLKQNNYCPLPDIGTLQRIPAAARYDVVDHMMYPPSVTIRLISQQEQTDSLVSYLSYYTGLSFQDAYAALVTLCNNIRLQCDGQPYTFTSLGDFFSDAQGRMQFTPTSLPLDFQQPVNVHRVIRSDSTHTITVGDAQVNSEVMTEVLTESTGIEAVKTKKSRWWIWVVIFIAASVGIILFYMTQSDNDTAFGNIRSFTPATPATQYQKTP